MDHELLTLTSNAATAVVDIEAGGRLASLIVDGVELLVPRNDDPVMWGCYPMVPFAGRIRDGRFAFDGTTYAMPKNFGDHAMHGFGFTCRGTAPKTTRSRWSSRIRGHSLVECSSTLRSMTTDSR